MLAKRFANYPFDAISVNRVADGFRGYRQPESRAGRFVLQGKDQKERVALATPATIHNIEFWFVMEPAGWRKCGHTNDNGDELAVADADEKRFSSNYTANRLRPLARRRDNTKRPPRVAMRARKP